MARTTPGVWAKAFTVFWSWRSRTMRSVTMMTEPKIASSTSLWSEISRCAVQPMVLDFPDPAECSNR